MDDALPSISSGEVGSRFVSQTDIDSAKEKRDEQWKAAYARLGQVPPPQPVEDVYDGRSLAEKLAANKAAKQEEWEEKTKLANQFRALEEDEVLFLDSLREEEERQERKREQDDAEEVKGFKQAVAARNALPQTSPPGLLPGSSAGSASSSTKTKPQPALVRKANGTKFALKGVVVNTKKRKSTNIPSTTQRASSASTSNSENKLKLPETSDVSEGPAKKPKLSSTT